MKYNYIYLIFIILIFGINQKTLSIPQTNHLDGTKMINIKFNDLILNKYKVEIYWFPNYKLPAPENGLVGNAMLIFVEPKTNLSFSIGAQNFYLSKKLLEKIDINNEKNTFFLNYENSFQVFNLFNPTNRKEQDKDPAPIFFEDVNFDGSKELVIIEKMTGQRWRDKFKVYQVRDSELVDISNKDPYRDFDSGAKFDIKNKTIIINYSGGACDSSYHYYRMDDKSKYDQKYVLYKAIVYSSANGQCTKSTFSASYEKLIGAYTFTLKSRKII